MVKIFKRFLNGLCVYRQIDAIFGRGLGSSKRWWVYVLVRVLVLESLEWSMYGAGLWNELVLSRNKMNLSQAKLAVFTSLHSTMLYNKVHVMLYLSSLTVVFGEPTQITVPQPRSRFRIAKHIVFFVVRTYLLPRCRCGSCAVDTAQYSNNA